MTVTRSNPAWRPGTVPRLRRRQRRRHPAGLRDDDRRLEADRRRRHLPALAGPRPLRRLRAKQGDRDPVPSLKPGLRRDRRPRPRRPRPDGSKSGVAVNEPNFGNYQRGNPNGTKFHDLNADGDRDPFEPGLEAWTILAYADDNGDGTLQASETTIADSKLTAVDGTYQLSLDPGHYVVCEQKQGDLDPVPSLKPGLRRDRRPRPRRPRPDGSKRRRRQRAELRQLPARQPQRYQVPRPERRR